MIINLKESPTSTKELTALERRHWYHQTSYSSARIATPQPIKVEFRKIMYAMPFLFVSGIFTGIAIMLALKG